MSESIAKQVERLRHHSTNPTDYTNLDAQYLQEVFGRAADTIEELEAQIEAVKAWRDLWIEIREENSVAFKELDKALEQTP